MTEKNTDHRVETLTGDAAGSAFWATARFYDVTFFFRAQSESEPLATGRLEISDDNGSTWRTAYAAFNGVQRDGRPITASQASETVAETVTVEGVKLQTGSQYRFDGVSTTPIDVRLMPAEWPTRT